MSYNPEIVPSAIFSLRANVLVNFALEKGASLDEMLAETGIDQGKFMQNNAYLCADQFLQLVRNFVKRFPDNGYGLEFGRRLNITTRGTVGLAVLSMSTLGESVRFGVKYQEVLEIPQVASIETGEDGVHIVFRYEDNVLQDPNLLRFLVESNLASYINTGRYLLHTHFDPIAVYLPYPQPAYVDAYYPLLGHQLHFNSGMCKLVLDKELLDAKLQSANPIVAKACYDACDDLLRNFRKNQTLTYRINSILLQRHGDYPTLKELSGMLNLDERTIRRRLALERTSYKMLLNEARTRHASKLLSVRSNSVESVAMALGFNNASNFRRAFKAWTGLNPGEYREQPVEPSQRFSA